MNVEPLYALVLTTPRLKLRLGTRAELVELGDLARAGIHPPDEMPFEVPWTDRSEEPSFVEDFVDYHERTLREWRAERWSLNLLAFFEGRPVGSQSVRGDEFSTRREVDTGSWLGRAYQRRGLGTEMRVAALEFAFQVLGAQAALSGSVLENESSKRVSEKLGYSIVGTSSIAPRGEPVEKYDLRIEQGQWLAPLAVEVNGAERCLHLFGISESS